MKFSPEQPLKVAVMSFAHTHARGYVRLLQSYEGISVLTCDPDPHPAGEVRGREMAEQLGVDYVETFDELLAWSPHAVVITSENTRHRELVELAAAAGADILCEKPLATTLEDGLAIRKAVEGANVMLMVAFPVRFASTFQKLKTAYQNGALGELVTVRGSNNGKLPTMRSWFTDPALSGGGALVDHVVHIADLLEGLMGANPVSVTALANQKLHAERAQAETAGLVTISYDNGVIAGIDCSWSLPDTAPTWGGVKINVAGTGGTAEIDFFGPRAHGLDTSTGLPIELPYGPDFDDALLSTFIQAVRAGGQPQPDVNVGLKTLQIVLAAQESVLTGKTISISDV